MTIRTVTVPAGVRTVLPDTTVTVWFPPDRGDQDVHYTPYGDGGCSIYEDAGQLPMPGLAVNYYAFPPPDIDAAALGRKLAGAFRAPTMTYPVAKLAAFMPIAGEHVAAGGLWPPPPPPRPAWHVRGRRQVAAVRWEARVRAATAWRVLRHGVPDHDCSDHY